MRELVPPTQRCAYDANVAAAAELLRGPECKGRTVAAVLCDSGLKYLSTTLWAEQ